MKTFIATYRVYLKDRSNYRQETKYLHTFTKHAARVELFNKEPLAESVFIMETV